LQGGVVEFVVIDQGMEAVFAAVPEVPDERALVEQVAVLLEEFVAQPVVEGGFFGAGGGEQVAFVEWAEGGSEQAAQAGGGGLFAVQRRQADDAVGVGVGFQAVRAERRAVGEFGTGLARPAVAEQPGDGDLQRIIRAFWMAVEQPLCGVVGARFR
jgi:hypothetical protein